MEETTLEILEREFKELQDEIRSMDQTALKAQRSIDDKSVTFDPYRYRQHKEKLKRQLPVLEIKMRRERDRFLKERRAQKQRERQELQPELNVTKADYHEAQRILEEKWKRHSLLELRAVNIEQQLLIDYEDMRNNQRALQTLIREITGVDEEDQKDLDN